MRKARLAKSKNDEVVRNLRLSGVTPSRIDVAWEAVKGAAGYNVYRGRPRDFVADDSTLVATVKEAGWADRNLSADTVYCYRVGAIVGKKEGPVCAAVEERTRRAGLSMNHDGSRLVITGDAFEAEWDLANGGEIVALRQYDGDAWVSILAEGGGAPGYVLESEGERYTLERVEAKAEVRYATAEEIRFAVTVRPRSQEGKEAGAEVGHVFHVFREGWIFCHLRLRVAENWPAFSVSHLSMAVGLDTRMTEGKCSWLYFDRKDRTAHTWKRPGERVEDRVLYPYAAVDWGLNKQLSFTNHLAVMLEDGRAIGTKEQTGVQFGADPEGGLTFRWVLHDGAPAVIKTGTSYRNCWGIGLGAARKGRRQELSAAQGNNMMGRGYWHWHSQTQPQGVPPGEDAEDWPWCAYGPAWRKPAGVTSPSNEEIDRHAEMGAKILIHHQTWMRSGGSNSYPPADYVPKDPADLKRMVDHAHARGLRVALYMRGVEPWALNMPYWEQFLTKDWDGLYVDWNSPLFYRHHGGLGEHQGVFKPWDERFYGYDYFRYTKMLRKRVGEGGILLGHANMSMAFLSQAVFDGFQSGESLEQKDHLCDSLDSHVFYSMKNCCGGTIINYVGPPKRARAMSAATGTVFQNERGPLWRMWASVPMDRVRVYDSLTENVKVLSFDRGDFHGCVYRASREECLITVANLGKAAAGVMEIDMAAVGLVGVYRVTEMRGSEDGKVVTREVGTTKGRVRVERLEEDEFCGYRLERVAAGSA